MRNRPSVKIALRAVGYVTLALFVLGIALYVYPFPLLWLLADRDPEILTAYAPGDELHPLAAVLRREPDAARESGLIAELRREGFSVDEKRRAASIHWNSAACENWGELRWTADKGKVLSVDPWWQAGCLSGRRWFWDGWFESAPVGR
jgi:hypothetical protein